MAAGAPFYNRTLLQQKVQNSGDHVRGMDWDLEIAGITLGGMTKFNGLRFEYEVTPYKHAESKASHCRPGHPKAIQFEIIREFTGGDMTFRTWRQSVHDGKTDRRSVSLKLKADHGAVVKTFDFMNCWALEYEPPAMDAQNSGHAFERIVLHAEEWKCS